MFSCFYLSCTSCGWVPIPAFIHIYIYKVFLLSGGENCHLFAHISHLILVHINMSKEDVKALEKCEADQYNEAPQKGFVVCLKSISLE